jgi:thiol-disulfide isomerase/thioredoxin
LLRTVGAALAITATVMASGCTSSKESVASGPQVGAPGYVSGNGTIKVFRVNDRETAPPVRGRLLDGGSYDIRDRVGRVVVVNFWASWCSPCRDEQPRLNVAYTAVRPKGVDFLGIDLGAGDNDSAAQAFRRTFAVQYPSIVDESGGTLLGFRGIPAYPPSTAVIDRDGRIAARIVGATPKGVLQPIIEQIAAEGTSTS